jgi:hypothetical protein
MLIRIHQMPSDHRHILIIIPMYYNNTMNDAIPSDYHHILIIIP